MDPETARLRAANNQPSPFMDFWRQNAQPEGLSNLTRAQQYGDMRPGAMWM
jgi:hypothetical protein